MEQTAQPHPPRQAAFITGLKGIACLIVALDHFSGLFLADYSDVLTTYPLFLAFNGTFSLNLFCLISAFLVAYGYYGERSAAALTRRMLCRPFRLALPILGVCLIVYALMRCRAYAAYDTVSKLTHTLRDPNGNAANYYHALPLLQAFTTPFSCLLRSTTNFTFPLWMMPTLFRGFYISVLVTLLLDNLRPLPALITGLLAAAFVRFGLSAHYTVFVFGVLLCRLFFPNGAAGSSIDLPKKALLPHALVCVCALLGALYLGGYEPDAAFAGLYAPLKRFWRLSYPDLFAVGSALLLLAVLLSPVLRRILSIKPLRFLGTISFGMYLLHDALQATLCTGVYLGVYRAFDNAALSILAAALSFLIAIVPLSYLFYRFVETPSLRLIDAGYRALSSVSAKRRSNRSNRSNQSK